jgi:cysteinyl-tRNA synthetase
MMNFQLYNTLTRQKEKFVPLDAGNVRMYVCGPTVYDFAHLGNARPVIVFDVLYRLLKAIYPTVTYVRNITDVDDKINAAAKNQGIDILTLTKETTQYFHEDAKALNSLPPDVEPRATDHIDDMITMIQALIDKDFAYAKDGHVLFRVKHYKNYGSLSRRQQDELIAGARVEVAPYKGHPGDFVLWKPSTDDLPGWNSPWGRGRPGWHIECSAMSYRYFGEQFDIHGGGIDLVFPHHENEVAQSCCAYETEFMAKYWLHNGHLMVYGEKMSKSLGNFFTVRDLLKNHHGETIRLAMLLTHYRQPLDWSDDILLQSKQILDRLYGAVRDVNLDINVDCDELVLKALLNDLNTPLAIAHLQQLASDVRANKDSKLAGRLIKSAKLLGLLQQSPEDWFQTTDKSLLSKSEIEDLIEKRRIARLEKRFQEGDAIRQKLLDQGIILEDDAQGTTWRVQ